MKTFVLKSNHNLMTTIPGCDGDGNFNMVKQAVPGTTILANDWNEEFLNIIKNMNPNGLAAACTNLETMQAMMDPIPDPLHPENPTIPQSWCQEARMIRWMFCAITGKEYWWLPPDHSLDGGYVTGGDLHDHTGVGDNGGGALIGTDALEDGAVTEPKIGTGAVTETKIGTGAVTEDKIGPGAITEDKIAAEVKLGLLIQTQHSFFKNDTSIYSGYFDMSIPNNVVVSAADKVLTVNFTPTAIGNIIEFDFRIDFIPYPTNSPRRVIVALAEEGSNTPFYIEVLYLVDFSNFEYTISKKFRIISQDIDLHTYNLFTGIDIGPLEGNYTFGNMPLLTNIDSEYQYLTINEIKQ